MSSSSSCFTTKQTTLAAVTGARADAKSSSSVVANVNNNNKMMECHVLPCLMDYTGTLPTANVYFQPTTTMMMMTSNDNVPKNDCSSNGTKKAEENVTSDAIMSDDDAIQEEEEKEQQTPMIQAACLRGRGLLSFVPSSSSSTSLHGRLLCINDSNGSLTNNKKSVHVEGCFDMVQEWYHEHDVTNLQNNEANNNSHIQTAMDYCQMAQHALHTPLPILE